MTSARSSANQIAAATAAAAAVNRDDWQVMIDLTCLSAASLLDLWAILNISTAESYAMLHKRMAMTPLSAELSP